MIQPTAIQIALLLLAACAFAVAAIAGLRHLRIPQADPEVALPIAFGPQARSAAAIGSGLCALLLVWRALFSGTLHNPIATYFDAFLLLGLILALLLVYFRLTRQLRSFCIFLLPMIAAVLLIGAALQLFSIGMFDSQSALKVSHIATVMVGSACFAVSCVAGVVYLFADRQLRNRRTESSRWAGLPPLGSIEKFNHRVVLLGFPFLTHAMITGIILTRSYPMNGFLGPSKVLLAILVWLIFGLLLLVRIVPSFRGRAAAQLSIAGFVVLIGVFITVTFVRH